MADPDTIAGSGRALRSGDRTALDLVEQVFRRADRLDPTLGVFLARFADEAKVAAQALDEALRAGRDHGPLHGVPLGIKDIIRTREGPTTAQSVVSLGDWGRATDAPVVSRLREAGAIVVGKVTLAEFAMGVPDPAKPFPVPRNPWDPRTWTGGSSSGTAGGIAAGLFPGGLGTDTGGSIRLPAAMCGVTGLRPTYGRVPVSGCLPMAPGLDTIGPMARTAEDCGLLFDALVGSTGGTAAVPDLSGLRVGVADLWAESDQVHPDQPELFTAAVRALARAGATTVDVELPLYGRVCEASLVIQQVEALAFHRTALAERAADYAEASRLYLAGAAAYGAADYQRARRVQRAGRRRVQRLFAEFDVIITPTTTTPAPLLATLDPCHLPGSAGCFHTRYWSVLGLPALSVPIGFTG
ncbi:MAG: amidase, partial [Micromonosporaceae bacterium]|nr:amidase [Micromonosporaceae bacterium]